MIDLVLGFLQDRLNQSLPRAGQGDPQEKLFVFAGTDKDDAVSFRANAVSMLLVRIEEEPVLRQADRFARAAADGARQRVEPEIRLQLWLLLVARFPDYLAAMRQLSRVIACFQGQRVFNAGNAPALGDALQQVTVELVTPTFGEQNEIWGALRTAYLPSLLYRVKMLVFQDQNPQALGSTQVLDQSVSQAVP